MRREEESQAIPMHKVSFEGIGALVPGVSTIEDAWIEYGGIRVTQVPEGEKFDIYCHYSARNEAGGDWKVTATVKGDGILNYEDSVAWWNHDEDTVKLTKMGDNIMPANDITLQVKLWLHDDANVKPPYPPTETW